MQSFIELWAHWSTSYPLLETLVYASGLILLSAIVNQVVKKILVRGFYSVLRRITKGHSDDFGVVKRLANIAPALVISSGLHAVPHLPDTLTSVILNVVSGFVILTLALALAAMLDVVNFLYSQRPDAQRKPIKGYLQVIKIIVFALATLLIIATLIDRSPLILFSGLGAMAAVLMLIFQDTLLSLVASVQISSGDMIRVGDWIEMPQQNADGDVIDIALHTVKIQNWDKTVTTVPTKRFISDSFKNWRGMQESGGRRIKRSLYLDQQSIHFLSEDERTHLERFTLLENYLSEKKQELTQWNKQHVKTEIDSRRLTNIGTFRAYVQRYLENHPGIHQHMTLLVRQLNPTPNGLPLEIYCFTNTPAWAAYENIQSDIFDHLYAIAPEFGLRVFQNPTGLDMRSMANGLAKHPKIEQLLNS